MLENGLGLLLHKLCHLSASRLYFKEGDSIASYAKSDDSLDLDILKIKSRSNSDLFIVIQLKIYF